MIVTQIGNKKRTTFQIILDKATKHFRLVKIEKSVVLTATDFFVDGGTIKGKSHKVASPVVCQNNINANHMWLRLCMGTNRARTCDPLLVSANFDVL